MRCLTLADHLTNSGWTCKFATRTESLKTVSHLANTDHQLVLLDEEEKYEAAEITKKAGVNDWLIIDHYSRDATFETSVSHLAKKILVIDDLANRPHECSLLLDQTFARKPEVYQNLVPQNTVVLAGSDYALLRPQFSQLRSSALDKRTASSSVKRIFISLGASDPQQITRCVLETIANLELKVAIDVVIGNASLETLGLSDFTPNTNQTVEFYGFEADISELMFRADLAIGAGGTTSWERCCLGLPTLVIVVAENQRKISAALSEFGAAVQITEDGRFHRDALAKKLIYFFNNNYARNEMAYIASQVCDGNGVERITTVMEQLSN